MFNVEKHVEPCVLSVLDQGFSNDKIEIILVDDESPDNSLLIAKDLENKYSCIKVISQKNKGLGGARNTGIKNSTGEYLLFLDTDDVYIKSTLEDILEIAKLNDLDILEFGAIGIDEKGETVYKISKSNKPYILSGLEYYNSFKYMNSACNKLYKKSFLIENNLFFIEKIYGEDFEFNTRALFYAKRVMAVKNIVAKFLQTEDSITRTNDIAKKRKYLNDLINILRKTKSFEASLMNSNDDKIKNFFNTRMTHTNIDVFFMMFKYKFSYSEITKTKQILKEEGLFFTKKRVDDFKKNIFRIFFLNFNFVFFQLACYFKKSNK